MFNIARTALRPTVARLPRRSIPAPRTPVLARAPVRLQIRCYAAGGFSDRFATEMQSGAFRRNRWAIVTFTALLGTAIGGAAYYMYLYNELVDKPLSAYPALVAKQIKQALWHASQNDPQKMANSFKNAIEQAEKAGLHPLSDEVAGLKIECAALLSRLGDGAHKTKAVQILEKVLDESVAGAEYFTEQKRWEDRTKVLMRAVLLGYKVGEMYTDLEKSKQAEEAMVWSTETLLREIHRRERDQVTDKDQGAWFDRLGVAGCLEKLADHYERTNQHTLAMPLYLRAATLSPQDNCHTVTLFGNLAASLSQQNPPAGAKVTREKLIEDGTKWALKALEVDAGIKPPNRTGECDAACVAATHNLGEMYEMLGDKKGALLRYEEALSLARGLKMDEGIARAKAGLERLKAAAAAAVAAA